ncbi:RidA family protein [Parasphingopyxis marina]|uniref:RidA family protein n=1 Tax=Parasphingopyxis marina TaxID=2761622 RepID=A0A842HY18_9SPHN|nr:Rid family hydrolase [Parasphingopyxis marina]MBC2777241.1 RidA family protein [Parasphingopyxis marina]
MRINNGKPGDIHPPAGSYSHSITIPGNSELVFVSGQVGMRPDGSIPESFAEQAELVFRNLDAVLHANGLVANDIVKMTTFIVKGQAGEVVRDARAKYLDAHRPASTAVYVEALVAPELLLEVECIAVRLL